MQMHYGNVSCLFPFLQTGSVRSAFWVWDQEKRPGSDDRKVWEEWKLKEQSEEKTNKKAWMEIKQKSPFLNKGGTQKDRERGEVR